MTHIQLILSEAPTGADRPSIVASQLGCTRQEYMDARGAMLAANLSEEDYWDWATIVGFVKRRKAS